jgi:hypothetical protein
MSLSLAFDDKGSGGELLALLPTAHLDLSGWGVSAGDRQSTFALPTMRWVCFEWAITAGTPGLMSIWIDDAPVTDLQAVSWNTPSIFTALELGFALVQSTDPIDLWVDEVMIDRARIGCTR